MTSPSIFMGLVLVLCILFMSSTTRSEEVNPHKYELLRKRYQGWLQKHGRKYKDKAELEHRFGIYQSNLKFIDEFNAKNLSFKLADNQFADMTNDEFKAKYLGYQRPRIYSDDDGGSYHEVEKDNKPLPDSIDWRDKGAVTPVTYQGHCGCCWAISAVSAVEGITQIKTGKLVPLSFQELLDCDIRHGNKGCRGGFMEPAFAYIKRHGGIMSAKEYPYKGKAGICKAKSEKEVATITGYVKVPPRNETALMAAAARQPVSVAVNGEGYPFQFYSEGILSGHCRVHLNHGVLAVGYGEEWGKKYWIVKNSWGSTWGESGYIRMERDTTEEGLCGIALKASYPVKDE